MKSVFALVLTFFLAIPCGAVRGADGSATGSSLTPELLLCVTTAISVSDLKTYAEAIRSYGGKLVLQGVPVRDKALLKRPYFASDAKTRRLIKRETVEGFHALSVLTKDLDFALEIRPELFTRYRVTEVPALIVRFGTAKTCGKESEDRVAIVRGAVTPDWAIEQLIDSLKNAGHEAEAVSLKSLLETSP